MTRAQMTRNLVDSGLSREECAAMTLRALRKVWLAWKEDTR